VRVLIAVGEIGEVNYYCGVFFVDYVNCFDIVVLWCFFCVDVGLGVFGDLMVYIVDMMYFLVGLIECLSGWM